jgi:hypothetical protein
VFSATWVVKGWRRKLKGAAPSVMPEDGDVYKPQARVDTRRLGH